MHWNNSETIVNTSTGKSVNESMQLIDSNGELVAEFSKTAAGNSQLQLPSGSNIQTVYSTTVTLTDAQIKALPTTPVQIVAAPGAGKYINYISGNILATIQDGGAYTDIDDDSAMFVAVGDHVVSAYLLKSSSATPEQVTLTDILTATTGRIIGVPQYSDFSSGWGAVANGAANLSDFENTALNLTLDFGSGNLTGGNAANTLKITVFYSVEDV